ncbi:MAG: DNA adenine methylase [Bacteroidetes bacterium]|nr:DNA adenine methylase [Bacteroidota bacterium]
MDIETGILNQENNTYKKVNSPFGYFGSKNRLALQLCENLPPHHCWVEAFCGSASMTLAKSPAPIEIINDIDDEIINLFYQLRNNQNELCEQIALTPYSSEELKKSRILNINDNDLERARKFLVQSMMAINGVFGEQRSGFSASNSYTRNNKEARVNRWYNLPERLSNVIERLKSIRIENRDAITLIEKFLYRPASLIYLDPPYFANRTNGYNKDVNNQEYHHELLKVADKAKCMVFISGYENDLYNSELTKKKGWVKKTFQAETKDSKGKSHSRTEVLWMNKYFIQAQETNVVPIVLTEKEKIQKKINPERK